MKNSKDSDAKVNAQMKKKTDPKPVRKSDRLAKKKVKLAWNVTTKKNAKLGKKRNDDSPVERKSKETIDKSTKRLLPQRKRGAVDWSDWPFDTPKKKGTRGGLVRKDSKTGLKLKEGKLDEKPRADLKDLEDKQ